MIIEFYAFHCYVKDKVTKATLVQGQLHDGLYQLDLPSLTSQLHSSLSSVIVSALHNDSTAASVSHNPPSSSCTTCNKEHKLLSLWHNQLGHPHPQVLQQVLKHLNILTCNTFTPPFCEACQQGKLHQFHFPTTSQKTSCPLQLVHSDVWGPAPSLSVDGYRYYVSFVDDFTRFVRITHCISYMRLL